MPYAAPSLIQAVDRYDPAGHEEDRLTELFASVLALDPDLTAWLSSIGLGVDEGVARSWLRAGYRVRTQVWISPTERPDLVVMLSGASPAARLYVEDKLDAPETAAQQAGYPSRGPDDYLLGVRPVTRSRLTGIDIQITWADVVRKADSLARARPGGGRVWRSRLAREGALAVDWRRHELIDYVTRKDPGLESSDPLSSLDVTVYARGRTTLYRVYDLFWLMAESEHLKPLLDPDGPESSRRSFAPGAPALEIKEAKDSWVRILKHHWPALEMYSGTWWAELVVSAYDDWVPEPLGEPAIGVGYCIFTSEGWPNGLSPDTVWAGQLGQHGITVWITDDGSIGRCFMTLYLGEVATHGTGLSEQAAYAAQWVAKAVEHIASQAAPNVAADEEQ